MSLDEIVEHCGRDVERVRVVETLEDAEVLEGVDDVVAEDGG